MADGSIRLGLLLVWACGCTPAAPTQLDASIEVRDVGRIDARVDPSDASIEVRDGGRIDAGVLSVGVGDRYSCAVLDDRRVYCWGSNINGRLGDGTDEPRRAEPAPVVGVADADAVFLGLYTGCARLTDGSAACWGDNGPIRIGTSATSPLRVAEPLVFDGAHRPIEAVTHSPSHLCVRTESGVHCAGGNRCRELGSVFDGDGSPVLIPVAAPLDEGVVSIASGVSTTALSFAATRSGEVWSWGSRLAGGCASDVGGPAYPPEQVPSLSGIVQVVTGPFFACALDGSGRAFCWGINDEGQLGDGGSADGSAPVEVAGVPALGFLAAGSAAVFAITADDAAVWAWGSHGFGGDARPQELLSPEDGVTYHSLASSSHSCVVRRSDGEPDAVLCGGSANDYDELGPGAGSTTYRPVVGLP